MLRFDIRILNQVLTLVLLDLPGLLFFSTYTLLVLFWAEIYHQASAYIRALFFSNYKFHTPILVIYRACVVIPLTAIANYVLFITLMSRQEVCQQISSGFCIFQLMGQSTLYRSAQSHLFSYTQLLWNMHN